MELRHGMFASVVSDEVVHEMSWLVIASSRLVGELGSLKFFIFNFINLQKNRILDIGFLFYINYCLSWLFAIKKKCYSIWTVWRKICFHKKNENYFLKKTILCKYTLFFFYHELIFFYFFLFIYFLRSEILTTFRLYALFIVQVNFIYFD